MSDTQDFSTNTNTNTETAATTAHDTHTIQATQIGPAATPSIRHLSRSVETLIAREVDAQFAAAGASRRDLRVLNMLSGERELSEHMRARLERRGGRLWSLADRGWITRADGDAMRATGLAWQLTDAGMAARERLTAITETVRERVAGVVPPEDYATTIASLEAIAREFGWTEDMRLPRGHRGGGRGHGYGHGRGHGHGHGHAHEGHGGCGHPHGRGGDPREGQRPARGGRGDAFERGFVAGFAASRDSA